MLACRRASRSSSSAAKCFVSCLVVISVTLKHRPYYQQCPSNIVECYRLNDSFDNVECCFDTVAVFGNNVAGFGNNVERNFVLSTMSKQIETGLICSTLSKGRNFTIESFDIVAVCGNKVECCFHKVERCFHKVERCFDNVACCFDIVAGVDGALQTTSYGVGRNVQSG